MEKTIITLLGFIHNYDLGNISGQDAQECMLSVDSLTNVVTQGRYSDYWASYYRYLDKEKQKVESQSEEKAKADAYKKTPEGQLENIYSDYAFVKKCNDIRKGYAIVYINDVEMENSRKLVKLKQEELLKKYPKLSSQIDAIWMKAARQIDSSDYIKLASLGNKIDNDFRFLCQSSYQNLNSSQQTKKDF
jgi:hypothetical protein